MSKQYCINTLINKPIFDHMQLIDTHSHIDTHRFHYDFNEVLERSRQSGVIAQILPGVCRYWWSNLLSLSHDESDLFPAIGLHPMYMRMHQADDLRVLESHCQKGNTIGIGEIGLDYYNKNVDRKKQQELFEAQVHIAQKYKLPILLHARKAHDQVQATLRRMNFSQGGIVHAYSGSLQQAEHYIRLGFKISIGGTITYSRAKKIRNVAASLPLEALVLETDAPDIPPAEHHGERNSPEYLPQILNSLAEIRDEPAEELARQTTKNAIDIVNLPEFPSNFSSLKSTS